MLQGLREHPGSAGTGRAAPPIHQAARSLQGLLVATGHHSVLWLQAKPQRESVLLLGGRAPAGRLLKCGNIFQIPSKLVASLPWPTALRGSWYWGWPWRWGHGASRQRHNRHIGKAIFLEKDVGKGDGEEEDRIQAPTSCIQGPPSTAPQGHKGLTHTGT